MSSVCAAYMMAAVWAAGQQAGQPGVAVINLPHVFERYQMTRDLEQFFEEKRQSFTQEAQKKRDDVTMKRNALSQFKPGTVDFNERRKNLTQAEIEFQVWLETLEAELKEEHKAWLLSLYDDVQRVVGKLAQERGFDLVLSYNENLEEDAPDSVALRQQILLRTVLFASERVDLTQPALERLDAEYQKRGGGAALRAPKPESVPSPP